MPRITTLTITALTLLLALGLTACKDDPPPTDPTPSPPTRAETPDEAMALFEETYAGRDLDGYRALLSADFLFIDQSGGSDDVATELTIADKMFHELEGENGIVLSDITIDHLQPQGIWTATPENDPQFGDFTGSLYRQYVIDLKFRISGQNLIYRVQGPVLFYVIDEGDDEPDLRLLGIVDATFGDKATEDHSWSGVRSLFD